MERRLIRKQSADLMSHDPRRDHVSDPESLDSSAGLEPVEPGLL
jgi:hypothetical protein